jgi:hypothetical protein
VNKTRGYFRFFWENPIYGTAAFYVWKAQVWELKKSKEAKEILKKSLVAKRKG